MSHRSTRISHSPWRDELSGREQRRRNRKPLQSKSKAQAREVEEEEEEQLKETVPRGTCQTMCPAQELRDREAQNRLHHFEILPGTERNRKPRGDPLRAVKEYSRPAAGKDVTKPADLRPPDVLLKTVCYLIDDIAASPNLHPWTEALQRVIKTAERTVGTRLPSVDSIYAHRCQKRAEGILKDALHPAHSLLRHKNRPYNLRPSRADSVYSFIFDRLRSVKQDMIVQRMSGLDCVAILERTVRLLIYASYRLCGEPLWLYDPRINDTHLQEYLSWLLDCYTTGSGPYPNQEEFQALGLLYNLGSSHAAQHVLRLPQPLRSSPSVTLALAINQCFLDRNPVRLLRLARRLNFLQACALHRHLAACRRDLLLIYSHGFSSRNCRFPLERLAQLLSLDLPLTAQLCQTYGVEVSQHSQVVFTKAAFTEAEGRFQCKPYHSIVSEKQKDLTIRSIIHDCT